MLPFAAQGAAMGIEDAAELGHFLANARIDGSYEQAMRNYQKARKKRVLRAAMLARTNRTIYHLPQPLSFARDWSMRLIGGDKLLARQDWLYAWRPKPVHPPESPTAPAA